MDIKARSFRMEFMSVIGNLGKYHWLERLWGPREEPTTVISSGTQIIPSCILIFILIYIDKCSLHPLSKKLLLEADGDYLKRSLTDQNVEN